MPPGRPTSRRQPLPVHEEGSVDFVWSAAISSAGGVEGTGVLITPDAVLTCAHVVRCLDPDRLEVAFPYAASTPVPQSDTVGVASVQYGAAKVPGVPDDIIDCAVLKLRPSGTLPTPAPLRMVAPEQLVGEECCVFGYPSGESQMLGALARGRVSNRLPYGWIGLELPDGNVLREGFSGGGLWSVKYGAVVGLVAQADSTERTGRALALPLVHSVLPEARIADLCETRAATDGRPPAESAQGLIEMGPGWSWVRVDFPWSSNVSLHHKAALSWTPSQGPDDRRMVVHTSAEAAYADLVAWISRRETTNSDRRELLQRLRHVDRSRQLIACCSHETVSPEMNPNFAPPAVVYCVYRVRQGTDARAVGWQFFTDWRRTMVYISPRSGRCMWYQTLPEGWSLHTVPLT
ncbi:serine protease [Streptomyces sp. NPDC048506]|uniref:S1 family peptidase n=1 Tax=Streptomyces sp. NPDC048506 TaxID=3155028 RepID=UPI003430E673